MSVRTFRRAAATVIAATGTAALLPCAAQATWPGLNGRVTLTQRVEAAPPVRANRDLFAYPLGTDAADARARLTIHSDNEEQSNWSPDGRWMAFKRRDAVWIVQPGSTQPARPLTEINVTDGYNNTQPAWSADGRRIVFRSNREEPNQRNIADIWILDVPVNPDDPVNEQALLRRAGDERYPSFSPDGRRLVFRGDEDGVSGNGDEEIYVAKADGTGATAVTDNDHEDSAPNWSPDGRRIAFQSDAAGNQDVYVMDADGSDVVRLTSNAAHDIGPVWSPDGRYIAFTRSVVLGEDGDIFVMKADGSEERVLAQAPVLEESPDWQPLPALRDFKGRTQACGDLSLEVGGVASVVAGHLPCWAARALARQWQRGHSVWPFKTTRTYHSFDQVVVELALTPKCWPWLDERVAFVVREPQPAALAPVAPEPDLGELEPEPPDEEPPGSEES
jgi:TolB protein